MKKLITGIAACALSACILAGCGSAVGIVSVEKTSSVGLTDTYTITYTDGNSSTFTVTNGSDGEDIAKTVNSSLLSSLRVACEFQVYSISSGGLIGSPNYKLAPVVQQGSAVIYKIDEDYTYAITNYHVIYNSDAELSKESKRVFVYAYGSEQTPYLDGSEYVYGDYAIGCEYIGGEIDYDIAMLKIETAELKKFNPDITAVEIENDFNVGDRVYTVGNTEGMGISVNSGVVSVDSEYITLKIDGTSRSYRSIRMDAAIHEGNSGGGLFNTAGKLIGINNAGSTKITSMNYAIPAKIVTSVCDNILYYYHGAGTVGAKRVTLGVTVEGLNSRFVYDSASGLGKIKEDISVKEITAGSIAESLSLAAGDIVLSLDINGVAHTLNRFFELGELLLTVRANDTLSITYTRGDKMKTATYTVKEEDLQEI